MRDIRAVMEIYSQGWAFCVLFIRLTSFTAPIRIVGLIVNSMHKAASPDQDNARAELQDAVLARLAEIERKPDRR